MNKIRAIAYYLPQYHPIPENDTWWGKGFTEWTNVTKAKPLFAGHKQPHFPADLGYYDLRVPEVREQQALLAREAGIEGFCYWHYWFGNGKRLLERPFKEVLESGKPDFPFCLAWANETWSGIWHGASDHILMRQEYPGKADYTKHFYEILPAFLDQRYIQVDSKPLFVLYNPTDLPDIKEFIDLFNDLAIKNGLNGIHIVANNNKINSNEWNPSEFGFNGYTISGHNRIMHEDNPFTRIRIGKPFLKRAKNFARRKIIHYLDLPNGSNDKPIYLYSYEQAMKYFLHENIYKTELYPTVVAGWDNSPRSGERALILTGYTPELFRKHVRQTIDSVNTNTNKIVFIKSWNEWAEGNYLEPESEYGTRFLDILRDEIEKYHSIKD